MDPKSRIERLEQAGQVDPFVIILKRNGFDAPTDAQIGAEVARLQALGVTAFFLTWAGKWE